MFGGDSLPNYYTTNSFLSNKFGWDINTIEDMIPFERDTYIELAREELERLNNPES